MQSTPTASFCYEAPKTSQECAIEFKMAVPQAYTIRILVNNDCRVNFHYAVPDEVADIDVPQVGASERGHLTDLLRLADAR